MEDNKQLELLTDQEKLGQYIEELSYDLKAFSHANSDIRYQIDHIKEILNKKEFEHYRPADMNTAFQKIFEYTDYINRLYRPWIRRYTRRFSSLRHSVIYHIQKHKTMKEGIIT